MKKNVVKLLAVVLAMVMSLGSVSAFAMEDLGDPVATMECNQVPSASEQVAEGEGIEFGENEQNLFETIFLNAMEYGVIDLQSISDFDPSEQITYGEFMTWIFNVVGEKHYTNTKKDRKAAIEVFRRYCPEAKKYKSSKKMTYSIAKKVISQVLYGKTVSATQKEALKNLQKETKINFPSLSLAGGKMSRIEALYYICMIFFPEMPTYYVGTMT